MATTKYRDEGARLKIARKLLRLTQGEVAEELGSSLAAVKSWERGNSRPNRSYAEKLAHLGINLTFVATGEGDPVIPPARRDAHGRMVERVLEGRPLVAMEPMAQLRSSTQVISDLCAQLDFTPALHWIVLLQELLVIDGLSERAARRILETLKEDERTPG